MYLVCLRKPVDNLFGGVIVLIFLKLTLLGGCCL